MLLTQLLTLKSLSHRSAEHKKHTPSTRVNLSYR